MINKQNIYFVLATAVFAGTGIFLQVQTARGGMELRKKPLPIRRPLIDMDRAGVLPYELIHTNRLPPETVEELGTEEYLNWILMSPDRTKPLPIYVSVTYYTGSQDQVPHVPEECLFQGGMMQASDETLQWRMPRLGEEVEIRRLSFVRPRDIGQTTYVYYTIRVNGVYFGSRDRVRVKMASLAESHLYYSKVEVSLTGADDQDTARLDEQAMAVMDRVLVELVKSHWPPRGSERGG